MANTPKTNFPMKASLNTTEPKRVDHVSNHKNLLTPNRLLHDGPPYANGSVHIGHGYNKILKDFYARANGAVIIPGWDCHGLPIENAAKKDKSQLPLKDKCKSIADKYSLEHRASFSRLGVLMNEISYKTMDNSYKLMEYNALKTLYNKGYLSRQNKPVHYCNKDRTVLAFSELEYKSERDTSVFFMFKTTQDTYIMCWTTTPWSIPANQAIGFSKTIQYCKFIWNGKTVYTSEKFAKQHSLKYTKVETTEIESLKYKSEFFNLNNQIIEFNVKDDKGTGFVHLAPSHGEDDYLFCKQNNILPITISYKFNKNLCESTLFQSDKGLEKTSTDVIEFLQEKGLVFDTMPIEHDVSICWRCKTPTIRVALKQTFITFKGEIPNIIETAKKINFIPEQSRNRFMSFLGNRTEWCISRQRTWGVPIPYIKNTETNEEVFLNNLTDEEFLDWDNYVCEDGYEKINEIVDVWFDSGVSHRMFDKQIDAIIEGSDQHRGWFQSSHILSVLMGNSEPFTKTIITHGFVLDGDGEKQSKSKGNVISPESVCNNYGADIFRLWVLSQSLDRDAKISDSLLKDVADSYRKIRNNIRYLLGNLHDEDKTLNINVSEDTQDKINEIKSVIIHNLTNTFDPSKVYHSMIKFSHDLSAWFDELKVTLYDREFDCIERRQIQADFRGLLNLYLDFCFIVLPFTFEELQEYVD